MQSICTSMIRDAALISSLITRREKSLSVKESWSLKVRFLLQKTISDYNYPSHAIAAGSVVRKLKGREGIAHRKYKFRKVLNVGRKKKCDKTTFAIKNCSPFSTTFSVSGSYFTCYRWRIFLRSTFRSADIENLVLIIHGRRMESIWWCSLPWSKESRSLLNLQIKHLRGFIQLTKWRNALLKIRTFQQNFRLLAEKVEMRIKLNNFFKMLP